VPHSDIAPLIRSPRRRTAADARHVEAKVFRGLEVIAEETILAHAKGGEAETAFAKLRGYAEAAGRDPNTNRAGSMGSTGETT
jgi:hypothetical protein